MNLPASCLIGALVLAVHGLSAADSSVVKAQGTGFVKVPSNVEFIIRGSNYTKVASQTYHRLLSVGTFDATAVNAQLAAMHASGYNTVRVFIDPHEINGVGGPNTLNSGYVSNLVQFINLASANSLYVILTFSGAPWAYTTSAPLDSPSLCNGSITQLVMNLSLVNAKQAYVRDVIKALKQGGAIMSNIFSYGIENEFHYRKECTPINNVVPQYVCPNGGISPNPIWRNTPAGTFDINTQCGQQQMQDANMVQYINQLTAAIKAEHSQALVTMGFFSPVIADANTKVRPYWAIMGSNLDYVSVHFNLAPAGVSRSPTLDWRTVWPNSSLDAQMLAIEEGAVSTKPIVMQEFYMNTAMVPNSTAAAYMARDAQIQACAWGPGKPIKNQIKSSLFWTWDTTDPDAGGTYWTMVAQSGNISGQLSPNVRPNPCTTQ